MPSWGPSPGTVLGRPPAPARYFFCGHSFHAKWYVVLTSPSVAVLVAVLVALLGRGCLRTRYVAPPSTPQDIENAIAAGGSVTLLEAPPATIPLTDTTREVRPVAIESKQRIER